MRSGAMRIGPASSPAILIKANGCEVVGMAGVEARPWRTRRQARAFARRISRDPDGYLDVVAMLGIPGVRDLRPWYGCGKKEGAAGGVVVQLDTGVPPMAPFVPDDPRLLTYDGPQAEAITRHLENTCPDLLAAS